jgi:hypothetical protein
MAGRVVSPERIFEVLPAREDVFRDAVIKGRYRKWTIAAAFILNEPLLAMFWRVIARKKRAIQ